MRIEFVEIANFRKLLSTRVGLSSNKTVFVGANNSGKTSAITALRYFLVDRGHSRFCLNDLTLAHWPIINAMGTTWEEAHTNNEVLPAPNWDPVLPLLDVWLQVAVNEVHYVQKILPTLDWDGGRLGVRMRLEPRDAEQLQQEYLNARAQAVALQAAGAALAAEQGKAVDEFQVAIWPQNLIDFLQRRLKTLFTVRAYILDPAACVAPEHGRARPQALDGSEPIDGDPFYGLIRIDEISAQRGFGMEGERDDESDDITAGRSGSRKLSVQLRQYYTRHLDPYENPDAQDLLALKAIEEAQQAFNLRLSDGFKGPLMEMHKLGYPGVTDPKLNISTRLRPVEGLNHDAAVQFIVPIRDGGNTANLYLPEDSNGLGYQNLISMVFRLMAFRDSWMRVGKAKHKASDDTIIPPLHLVLIEEPEVHLHTQVQQVFIRQAHKILRNHPNLGNGPNFVTQMVVSTHSSHIAHECEFDSLRYFRRLPGGDKAIPTSCVVNLENAFGADLDTKRFVTRYLRVTHCDLFFADAAVLIEGPAERILIPNFVNSHAEFQKLSESYITWLEIGGSHAHKLRSLVEKIGLTTLVITDIDSCNAEGASAPPVRGANYTTRNATLRTWWPLINELDPLLDKPENEKVKTYADENFSVRVAYQSPIQATFKGEAAEALSYTLEDAIVMANLDLFATMAGTGLIAKFRTAIADSANLAALSEALKAALQGGGKAEFALDLLEIENPLSLRPPNYIKDGLVWLADQLEQKQSELGLVQSAGNDDGQPERDMPVEAVA
ncbi:AAA family ATPase [Pusillimonas noertemannii]|uniref:Putative ATP-dependent endonuclease of OLD family n=1 Tax=Pusillimonas noertemannii TaxID=305977 RepID=A0A2U1CMC3_9BURK|nr:AAA family ATPase [Pusillimonas noertemannii]NYT68845.1 AAA family ATPase [Pusillimonas noertemannii]PVY62134.1 putative ATP-dependent endonuclease of OLD family [Pusillimonas noertemannii]TFL10875.1 ATP-dependent endonuclease [Pusillimonas noertemannii]